MERSSHGHLVLSARRFFAPGVELSRYWNMIHKSENKVSALTCFGQRGLPRLPSCSQGLRATAQRTPQVVEDAQMWHVAAEIPKAQRSCDCVKEHRSGEWVGSRKKYIFGRGDFIVCLISPLPKCLRNCKMGKSQVPPTLGRGKQDPICRGEQRELQEGMWS